MKRLVLIFTLISCVAFVSCKSSTDKKVDDAKKTESTIINDCEDFIEHYEEWGDKYIEVIDLYMKNPADEKNATKYMELMQEAMVWATKWTALIDCADNEEYSKRFENVAKEIEAKLQELGL